MNTILRLFQRLNRCDWYVFFWCIYQLQEILYPPGIINQGIQALIMAWAVYEAGIYILPQRNLPLMLKATSLLLLMYFVYGLVFIVGGADYYDRPMDYLKSFCNSFLPIFLFYKFTKQGLLTEKRIRIYFFFFLGLIIAQFRHEEVQLMEALRAKGSSRTETTNNTGYYFVSLLPMLCFWYKNRVVQYCALPILLLFVLLGVKRGAIGLGGLCAIWFLWDNIKNSTSKKHKYQTVVFGVLMAIVAAGAVSYRIATSEYFQERIEETQKGDASGRDVIYAKVFEGIVNDDSYIHLFIGRGAYSTLTIAKAFAHQDWLETACNNGLLGVIVLAFFFFAFFKTAKNAFGIIKPEYRVCLMMLFFVRFGTTWFSMSLENMPIYVTMLMSYLTYHTYKDKRTLDLYSIS